MTSMRVDALGERIKRDHPLQFTFNGQTFNGLEGDTLASALLAHNQLLINRSCKYHRPRGIVTAGSEEPSALAQLESGESLIPNAKIPEVQLYDGLSAQAVNTQPGAMARLFSINRLLVPLLSAGFYYKTFMWPVKAWRFYEKFIRNANGLGTAPKMADSDRYVHQNVHCEVLIVGGGIAGLMAARALVDSGARVIVCELSHHLGGSAHRHLGTIDGKRASVWVKETEALLARDPLVTVLRRTVAFGSHTGNFFTLRESLTDHLPVAQRSGFRERLWRVFAKQTILATGAHERPMVFGNNDLPGIMLSSAMADYAALYGVRVGKKIVIATTNDSAYSDAVILQKAGARVTVVDTRTGAALAGSATHLAVQSGIEVFQGVSPVAAKGSSCVTQLMVKAANGAIEAIACDAVGMSGGWNPVVHLHSQAGGKVVWDTASASFRPSTRVPNQATIGACNASWTLAKTLLEAQVAAQEAAKAVELPLSGLRMPLVYESIANPPHDFWMADLPAPISRRPKAFVDYQNDVTAADIALAVREGLESMEHIKRYTGLGSGTDQGKLGDVTGMALAAKALGIPMAKMGTIAFEPNYLPISFGALAGVEVGELFCPIHTTSVHQAHVAAGAVFEDIGQWRLPGYFPQDDDTLHQAVEREVNAARTELAIMDISMLGKIEINGPDAVQLLDGVYTNAWSTLETGRCRYGLMLDENGMVFDDGVTARLGECQYLMTTTSTGAERVMNWMERWLQTEWPHLKVYLTCVTDHWSTFALMGPKSRDMLSGVCEGIHMSDEAFPFMSWRASYVLGVPARVMRVGFSGELAYEINVPSDMGASVWQGLMQVGAVFGITPCGTEAMHVLRAEKGHILVGHDTDGSMSPMDLGMGSMLDATKDFIGRRSLRRDEALRTDRKQLVGLLTQDPHWVLPEGSQLTDLPGTKTMPVPMIGHVTSSCRSPTLGRSIALAVVKGGHRRLGETVYAVLPDGQYLGSVIANPVFFDPQGERQNG